MRPPVSTKTGNDQQGRPFLRDSQVLQKNPNEYFSFLLGDFLFFFPSFYFFSFFLLSLNIALP